MNRKQRKYKAAIRGIQFLVFAQFVMLPVHLLAGENDRRGEDKKNMATSTSYLSPVGKCEEGRFIRLLPNGTAFAGVDCRPTPETICWEAHPQEGGKTFYIFDPCGENISIMVNNNPDRTITEEQYVDPETGENGTIYWFDPPLEPEY